MVNPSRIQKEQKTFNLILETYNKEISGVSSSWKGSSYNNLKSEASSFIGKANKISSYFSSYARAASLYQEYKDQKQIHREYLHKYNNADELNPQRLYYKKRKEHAYEKMNDLKKQIRTQLKSIGSVVCSDTGNPTEIPLLLVDAEKIKDAAYSYGDNPYSQYPGGCEALVNDIYTKAGYAYRGSCCAHHSRENLAIPGSENGSIYDIPDGAVIYSGDSYHSGVTCSCGRNAGHVAVYVGDGKVYGSQTPGTMTIEDWTNRFGYGGYYYPDPNDKE